MNTKIFTPICNNGLNHLSTLKYSGDVFLVKNLFNELTKDWEKAKARENLGVSKALGAYTEIINLEVENRLQQAIDLFAELLNQVIEKGSENIYQYMSENRYERLKEAGQLDPDILYLLYEGDEEEEEEEPIVVPTGDIEILEDSLYITNGTITDNILEIVGTVEGDTLVIQIGTPVTPEPVTPDEPEEPLPEGSNITISDNIINSLLDNINGDTLTVEGIVDGDTLIIIQ